MNGKHWGHSALSAFRIKQSVPNQSGIALVAVLVFLLVIAAAVALKGGEELGEIQLAAADTEVRRIDYAAAAGMQHALWQARNSACTGDFTVPTTSIGPDEYSATTTGGGSNTVYPLPADQDAWIRSDNPTNTGGGDQHIRAEGTNFERALFRFNLSTVPANAQVRSATAWFYVEAGKGHPEGVVTVHRVTGDWTEAGASWADMNDKFDPATLGMIAPETAGGGWVPVNLTAQVQAWVNGQPNYGIGLAATAEGIHTEYKSREDGATPPRLEVVVGATSASPLNISAIGTLANGKTRTLSQPLAIARQPPATVMLQLGIDPGEDAILDSFYSARNYGGADYVQVNDNGTNWQQYPLIRFALSGVPRGAAVRSAQLELRLVALNTPGSATVHRVTRDWVEGTKSGTGTADGATWFTFNGFNAWASPGGDFEEGAVAETAITGGETWVSWDIAPLVQRWLAGEPNFGLMLRPAGGLREADFASKEDSSVGVQPRLTITYACECGSACMAPQGSGNVLMVIGSNPFNPAPEDVAIRDYLESWGYTVTLIQDDDSQGNFNAGVAANDAVFISESVSSGNVGTKLTTAPIGVVNAEGLLNDELGISTGRASPVGQSVDVVDNAHYITQVFPSGSLGIKTHATELQAVSGTVAPGAQPLAQIGGAGSIVILDGGATTAGGGTAAGRRVLIPAGEAVVGWGYLTADGQLVVQRAIAWAMGADVGASGSVLLVVANAATPSTRSAGRKTLMESWGYAVTLIDDGDSQANFNNAMAANDVVYVTDTVSGPTLQDKVTNTTTPVVNEKGSKLGNFGFSSVESGTVNAASFTATDATHYITEPFSGNLVTVFSSSLSMGVPSGTLAPDLQNVGEVSGTAALATLVDGATLWNGGSAPARRAHLPLGAAETTQLTADGQTIMQRAIEWAAGADINAPVTTILSTDSDAILGGLSFTDKDLAEYNPDTSTASLFFDGGATTLNVDITALHVLANGHFVLAAKGNPDATLGGETFQAGDLVDYDPVADSATLIFDGDALFTDPAEKITSVHVLDDGNIVLSTDSDAELGGLSFSDLDLAEYDPGTGTASLFFDGDVTTLNVDITALHVLADGHLILAGKGNPDVTLGGVTFQAGDLVDYDPVADSATLIFDGDVLFTDPAEKLNSVHVGSGSGSASAGPGPQTVLLVVANAASPSSRSADRRDLIESWSHTVTLIDDGDSQTNFNTAMAANDVVYVTDTVSGPTLQDKVTNTTKPIVNEKGSKLGNFGFSSVESGTVNAAALTNTDALHYISEPFAGNPVTVFTSSMSMGVPSGTLAPDLQNVGEVSGTLTLVTLDAGATLWSGGSAASRRVYLPLGGAEVTQLTADGKTLMQRAIDWAAGEGAGTGGGGGGPPACDDTFRDEFNTVSFGNNDGTLNWAGDWLEVGESDGPGANDVRVRDDNGPYQLWIRDNNNGGEGAERQADLSGATAATLSFIYRRSSLDTASDYVKLEISANGAAGPWTELARFEGPATDSAYQTFSQDITSDISANTRIRLISSPTMGNLDLVIFEDVEICVTN